MQGSPSPSHGASPVQLTNSPVTAVKMGETANIQTAGGRNISVSVVPAASPIQQGRDDSFPANANSGRQREVKEVQAQPARFIARSPEGDGNESFSVESGQGAVPDSSEPESLTSSGVSTSEASDSGFVSPDGANFETLETPSSPLLTGRTAVEGEQSLRNDDFEYSRIPSLPDDELETVSVTTQRSEDDPIEALTNLGPVLQEVAEETEQLLRPPESQLPATLNNAEEVDDDGQIGSISISNEDVDDGSISIEGGGETKKSLRQRIGDAVKSGFKKIFGALGNKLRFAVLAIFLVAFVLCVASLGPAAPAVLVLLAILLGTCLLTSVGYCAGIGLADLFFPIPAGDSPNPNPPDTPEKKKSDDESKPSQTNSDQNPTSQSDTDGQFLMTEQTSDGQGLNSQRKRDGQGPNSQRNRDGQFSTTESQTLSATQRHPEPSGQRSMAFAAAQQTEGGQDEDELAQHVNKFEDFIINTFSSYSSKARATESSEMDSEADQSEDLEKTLAEISDAFTGLFYQFKTVETNQDTTRALQEQRMKEVEKQMNKLLAAINPDDKFIDALNNKIYSEFADPLLSVNTDAPLLTIGAARDRLSNFAPKDMRKVEFFDLLMQLLRTAKAFKGGEMKDRLDGGKLETQEILSSQPSSMLSPSLDDVPSPSSSGLFINEKKLKIVNGEFKEVTDD